MTRLLLLAALLTGATCYRVVAQTAPVGVAAAQVPHYQFCELTYDGSWLRLNYGKEEYAKQYRVDDERLLAQAVVIEKLHSPSVALNYLNEQGWEVVGVSTVTTKTNATGTYTSWERVYTLRHPVLP